jgi:flavin-dependent dehydrogenase
MSNYDVVIVGACTAGTYFSNLLAKQGLKVLVIDKDEEEKSFQAARHLPFHASIFPRLRPRRGEERRRRIRSQLRFMLFEVGA